MGNFISYLFKKKVGNEISKYIKANKNSWYNLNLIEPFKKKKEMPYIRISLKTSGQPETK